MIVDFAYPSSSDEAHFVHGPLTPYRVRSLDELPRSRFKDSVEHHLVDQLDDDRLPAGDVFFGATAPRRLGLLPVDVAQWHRMLWEDVQRDLFRSPLAVLAREDAG